MSLILSKAREKRLACVLGVLIEIEVTKAACDFSIERMKRFLIKKSARL